MRVNLAILVFTAFAASLTSAQTPADRINTVWDGQYDHTTPRRATQIVAQAGSASQTNSTPTRVQPVTLSSLNAQPIQALPTPAAKDPPPAVALTYYGCWSQFDLTTAGTGTATYPFNGVSYYKVPLAFDSSMSDANYWQYTSTGTPTRWAFAKYPRWFCCPYCPCCDCCCCCCWCWECCYAVWYWDGTGWHYFQSTYRVP